MSLSVSILKDKMISNVNQSTDPQKTNDGYASAISEHILSYCELKGSYIGITPKGDPDPANGTYVWKPVSCGISGSAILAAIRNVSENKSFLQKYNDILSSEIKLKTKFGGKDKSGVVTISKAEIIVINIDIDMSSKPTKKEDSNIKMAEAVINGIKNAVPTVSIDGTSVSGKGTVTFSNFE